MLLPQVYGAALQKELVETPRLMFRSLSGNKKNFHPLDPCTAHLELQLIGLGNRDPDKKYKSRIFHQRLSRRKHLSNVTCFIMLNAWLSIIPLFIWIWTDAAAAAAVEAAMTVEAAAAAQSNFFGRSKADHHILHSSAPAFSPNQPFHPFDSSSHQTPLRLCRLTIR